MSSESFSELAIHARGLSKAYRVFSRPEDRLKQMLFGKFRSYYREFWALRDVDLDVRRGEAVGIIGRNGSGKSTLLQMICGTLAPTSGDLTVRGRVAALLELGAGFNPDFTGRENVFLNGAILGLDSRHMQERFDAIAAFADIGEFLEQPVKTYSSGMHARLAFAVAINVDPEILVIDEALSVGDEAFQRKCFARIGQIRDNGATVLFVSHGAGTIISLCDRAVLLDHGQRLLTADPKTTVAKYQKLAYAPPEQMAEIKQQILELDAQRAAEVQEPAKVESAKSTQPQMAHFDPNLVPKSTVAYVSRGVVISDAMILDTADQQVNILATDQTYRYRYTVTFDEAAHHVRFGMMIKTVLGVELAGCASHADGNSLDFVAAGSRLAVTFEFQNLLAPGAYFLNAGVLGSTDQAQNWLHRVLDVAMFRVDPTPGTLATGLVNLMTSDSCHVADLRELAKV